MNKKAKRWRTLTAAVCFGIGVMTGMVGLLPAAQAEPYGVVMDMRLTQTIPYRVHNFTPYRLELVTENSNNTGSIHFATGLPRTIASMTDPDGKNSAMMYVMYKSYQGSGVWSPIYRLREPSGNYINIEFKTDVREERLQNVRMDALPFVKNVISCVGNIVSIGANPANVGAYITLVSNVTSAVQSYNSIEVKNFTSIPGVGYVYGTSSNNASNLILKNDATVVQVGDGASGEQLVIETIAVRQPSLEIWSGESGAMSWDKKKGTVIAGGKQFAGVNIYTQAQYLTCASIVVATDLIVMPGGDALAGAATFDDMPNAWGNDLATTGFERTDGLANESAATAYEVTWPNAELSGAGWDTPDTNGLEAAAGMRSDGAMNEECARLTKQLAEPIVKRKVDGKYVWFTEQMAKLTSGQRIDVYEALYEAQKKRDKTAMENPLQPVRLREALAGTAELDGAAVQGEISDKELADKLRLAMKNLGINEEQRPSGRMSAGDPGTVGF